ncbi:MAG: thiamine-phosphate pyrophosphorylase [Gemmatimonadetes bacterium]|nr:thiamine-phosphate pyrophosphorylase [Gemmatimonadota bacterium]
MNLPRVHAITDARVLAFPGFLEAARRLATLGARVAIHLRDRTASGRALADQAVALRDTLAGTGTALILNARPDIAAAVAAQGVQLGEGDLSVADARRVFPRTWVGRSVHGVDEARAAAREGADYLIAGTTYPSASHAGQAPRGTGFISEIVAVGPPVLAIGGVTPERADEVHATGAHGVAAIRGIWGASDPAQAVARMLEPWEAR